MADRYSIRKHDDHWHAVDSTDENPVLDDRPYNPWQYARRKDAAAVVALLNHGVPMDLVRLMSVLEIHSAVTRVKTMNDPE